MDERILAVQRMQDYIEQNCDREISMADLAGAALFSPWYARRLFLEKTGYTPAEYIRRLRLSRSALQLRDTQAKVLEVALANGFDSAEGYQRAFFREFGRNPKEYARDPVPLPLFHPYGVAYPATGKEKYMQTRNIFIRTVDKPARKALIKRGVMADEYMSYCEEVGCDIWGLLLSIPGALGEPVCLWLPEKWRDPITNSYVQGVEVPQTYEGTVPGDFDVLDLPAGKFLEFRGEPFEEAEFEDAIQEVWEAEKKLDPAALGFVWDDANPRYQLEPVGSRGYIELMPVRDAK